MWGGDKPLTLHHWSSKLQRGNKVSHRLLSTGRDRISTGEASDFDECESDMHSALSMHGSFHLPSPLDREKENQDAQETLHRTPVDKKKHG